MSAAARFQFVCRNGCGLCRPLLAPFEYSRTEGMDGSLVESLQCASLVSDCCGNGVDVWDEEAEEVVGDLTIATPPQAKQEASTEDARPLAAEREPSALALTDEQIVEAWDAWPRTSITSRAGAVSFVRAVLAMTKDRP